MGYVTLKKGHNHSCNVGGTRGSDVRGITLSIRGSEKFCLFFKIKMTFLGSS